MTDTQNTDKAMEEMLGGEPSTDQAGSETRTEEPKSTETPSTETDETKTEKDESPDAWKERARLWESRSKENKDKADKYDQSVTRISELEAELTEAKKLAGSAEATALRFKVAAKHGLSEEDVELFLNGSDEETLNKQAERLPTTSARIPKPDAHQGNRDANGDTSTKAQGSAALGGLFD